MSESGGSDDELVVRAGTPRDQRAVLALNNESIPHVNALTEEQFSWLATKAAYYRIAEQGGELAGFVMAIQNGTEYWSRNYAWFEERYAAFIYLDRVVVASRARRQGVGRTLYNDLIEFAADKWPRITLEVNLQPPNPGSLAFHERLAFQRVGSLRYAEGEVAMFELPLQSA